MNVLVTGGAGYIGSILLRDLISKGYHVKCLDRFFFGRGSLSGVEDQVEVIEEDTRTFDPNILKNVDIVVDLAAISQPDPKGLINPLRFYDINYVGTIRVATLSKKAGVQRYVFPSTCSTYGCQNAILDENSPLKPLETYAETKSMAEKAVLNLLDKKFCVTTLRLGTVYGMSPKMRFDLVLNGMTLSLFKTGVIKVMRDGNQIRPIVHVRDVTRAILAVIEAEAEKVGGEVFNVGSNDQNFKIIELARLIGESIGIDYRIEWYGDRDTRSYRVNFDKISKVLGVKTKFSAEKGAKEVYLALQSGEARDTEETHIIKWYKLLQDRGNF